MLLDPLFRTNVLLWESAGSPSLLRDVTGEALFSSAVAWFCVEIESVVTLLVLRCYGFYEVLDSPRWFVSADVKARVQRTGFRVAVRKLESDEGEKQESDLALLASFKQTNLTPPTEVSSNQMVLVGRSSAHVHGAYYFYTCDEKIRV